MLHSYAITPHKSSATGIIDVALVCAEEALSRAEMSKAELELEINKVKTEEASLRDALLKMQALNEGLGQDKIELNRIIMQVLLAQEVTHVWD